MQQIYKNLIIFPIYDEYSSSHKHFHVMMTSHGKLNCFKALRLRGRGDDPNHDSKNFEIPYLTNAKFRWDGLPCIDFREKVLNVLENGLGSMLINGETQQPCRVWTRQILPVHGTLVGGTQCMCVSAAKQRTAE